MTDVAKIEATRLLAAGLHLHTRWEALSEDERRFLLDRIVTSAERLCADPDAAPNGRYHAARHEVEDAIEHTRFTMAAQPIVWLPTDAVVGFEALARFDDGRPPDAWFAAARRVGLGPDLERATVAQALGLLDLLPPDVYLSVNVSPDVFLAPSFLPSLPDSAAARLVVELTEHRSVDDYDRFRAAVQHLRERGGRLAVDDAGAGQASLRHIVQLHPDIVKLDRSLLTDAVDSPVRQALLTCLATFSHGAGITLVAEGVEDGRSAAALVDYGIGYAQGYWFGRPGAVPVLEPHPEGGWRLQPDRGRRS